MNKEIKAKAIDFKKIYRDNMVKRERKVKSLKVIEKVMKREGIGLEELIVWMLKGDLI